MRTYVIINGKDSGSQIMQIDAEGPSDAAEKTMRSISENMNLSHADWYMICSSNNENPFVGSMVHYTVNGGLNFNIYVLNPQLDDVNIVFTIAALLFNVSAKKNKP